MAKKTGKTRDSKPKPAPARTSTGELTDEQQQALYWPRERDILALRKQLETITANLRNQYKGMKADLGITKADFDYALGFDKEDGGKTIETHQRRMKIARWKGHPVATQGDLFADNSRAAETKAAATGSRDGTLGNPCKPEGAPGTKVYDIYMEHYHAGQVELGKGFKRPGEDVNKDGTPKSSVPRDQWKKDIKESNDQVADQIKKDSAAIAAERAASIGDKPASHQVTQ